MEQLHHDLNTYFECQVRINNANTLNVKLFPEYSQPPKIFDYQVPILVSQLETEKTWDLSVQKVGILLFALQSLLTKHTRRRSFPLSMA